MKDDTIYRLIKFCIRIIGTIPRPVARRISNFIGRLWYAIDQRHRTVVLENIGHAYGSTMTNLEIKKMARQIFKNIAGMLFEVSWAYNLKPDQLAEHISFKGWKHLEAAISKNRGVLTLTCHMGNWELLCWGVSMRLKDTGVIYRKLDYPPLDRFMLEYRERFGAKLIPLKRASRKVDELFAEKYVVGTLFDQSVDWYQGCYVDFFGRLACTNRGVASLVMRTGVPVVPMFIIRDKENFIIEFLPEVPTVVTDDRTKDLEVNTQNYTSAVETIIRRCPEQWFWVHNRWKTKAFCPWPRAVGIRY